MGPVKHLAEFRGEAGEELKVGAELKVGEVFEKGQKVKVSGKSKGKGFQGTIKRHNFHRGPVSHGSHNVRAPGSIGASGRPGPGLVAHPRRGAGRVTQRGLENARRARRREPAARRRLRPGPRGTIARIREDQ